MKITIECSENELSRIVGSVQCRTVDLDNLDSTSEAIVADKPAASTAAYNQQTFYKEALNFALIMEDLFEPFAGSTQEFQELRNKISQLKEKIL